MENAVSADELPHGSVVGCIIIPRVRDIELDGPGDDHEENGPDKNGPVIF